MRSIASYGIHGMYAMDGWMGMHMLVHDHAMDIQATAPPPLLDSSRLALSCFPPRKITGAMVLGWHPGHLLHTGNNGDGLPRFLPNQYEPLYRFSRGSVEICG
jgi:hypothetical protein